MPNFSGIWTTAQQFQARGQSIWPSVPGTPTIGTASAAGPTSAFVAFTASAIKCYVGGVTFTAVSTPGCITSTGSASPLTVSGLTTGVSYTFRVRATNSLGTSAFSSASNSVVPVASGQQQYTTSGTYSWVAPAGVTSVSVVVVGGGGGGAIGDGSSYGSGGAGGALAYGNNISVTPGASYSLVVGAGGASRTGGRQDGISGSASNFINSCTLFANGGGGGIYADTSSGGVGGGATRSGGGSGGNGGRGYWTAGGGGAGGYSGNGGAARNTATCGSAPNGIAGSGGGGGGGGGGGSSAAGGGGVGLLGQGPNGSGGIGSSCLTGGGGGSGGSNGGNGSGFCGQPGGAGGLYGGGGGGVATSGTSGAGGGGAVRIIWPGNTRQFPSTCTGNL